MGADAVQPGTIIGGFDIQTPLNDETCRAHIAASLAAGYPDAVGRKALTVIANGPSARGVDLRRITQPTLALNGALQMFVDQGVTPTYWACCDPQACVAGFIPDDPPAGTIYLVASKCHASVFEKLKGRDVRLWHVMDYPANGHLRTALCSSVTLSASWLMQRLGYTDFEYHGWDGCFLDGRHHAGHVANVIYDIVHINYGGKIENGEVVGGRTFATTRTWAAEAQGAQQFFQLAKYLDINVTLHGDGMFKAAQKFIFEQD